MPKPTLPPIYSHTESLLTADGLVPEAKVKVEVTNQGQSPNDPFWTVATAHTDPIPAPPMTEGATVRICRGQCDDLWSDWSDPITIPKTFADLSEPTVGDLFHCQDSITVYNLSSIGGTVQIT